MPQISAVDVARGCTDHVFSTNSGVIEGDDVGKCGERRQSELGPGYGVEKEDGRSFVEDGEPAVRRAAPALAEGGLGEVEEVDFVVGEVEKGTAGVVVERNKEPWELGRKMERDFGDR